MFLKRLSTGLLAISLIGLAFTGEWLIAILVLIVLMEMLTVHRRPAVPRL